MIFEIIRGGGELTGWGKNGPAYFFPGERMGRPILSPGKKLTGGGNSGLLHRSLKKFFQSSRVPECLFLIFIYIYTHVQWKRTTYKNDYIFLTTLHFILQLRLIVL